MARKTSSSIVASITAALEAAGDAGATYTDLQRDCSLSQMTVRRFCRIGVDTGEYVAQIEHYATGVMGTRRLRIWLKRFAPASAIAASSIARPSREVAYMPKVCGAFDRPYVSLLETTYRDAR